MSLTDKKKITIVTHSGNFHTDEIFAVAVLLLVLEKENDVQVIRSREQEVMDKGDYVVDVGGVYNPDKNRFDHHQIGGAGVRENGIPYASFGLVWKKYGEKLCGSQEASKGVDQILVQPIDIIDNGVDVFYTKITGVTSFDVGTITSVFRPTWKEEQDLDKAFFRLLSYAEGLLERVIKTSQDYVEGSELVKEAYNKAADKRIIFLEEKLPWLEVLSKYLEPTYVVYPKVNGTWSLKGIRNDPKSFVLRKALPESWAGMEGLELEKVTSVEGAIFCHRDRFTAVAKTKEAILKLAEIALNS